MEKWLENGMNQEDQKYVCVDEEKSLRSTGIIVWTRLICNVSCSV